jgi:hypothetical protein
MFGGISFAWLKREDKSLEESHEHEREPERGRQQVLLCPAGITICDIGNIAE